MPKVATPIASLVLARHRLFEWSQVGEEVVILNPGMGELLRLSSVAGFLWKELDGRQSFCSLVQKVCRQFDVDSAAAEKDTGDFLQHLMEWDLVEVIHEP